MSMLSRSARVFGAREAAAEGVRIEARRGHQRDHVAVVRVDGDHRAAPADESLLGDELRGQVDAGDDVVARRIAA